MEQGEEIDAGTACSLPGALVHGDGQNGFVAHEHRETSPHHDTSQRTTSPRMRSRGSLLSRRREIPDRSAPAWPPILKVDFPSVHPPNDAQYPPEISSPMRGWSKDASHPTEGAGQLRRLPPDTVFPGPASPSLFLGDGSPITAEMDVFQEHSQQAQLELESVLTHLYHRAVEQPPGQLDTNLIKKKHDLLSVDRATGWVYSPQTLAALLCRRWLQVLLAAVGVAYLAFGSHSWYFVSLNGVVQSRFLRLTALELREGGNVSEAHIENLGVLYNGCQSVVQEQKSLTRDGPATISEYNDVFMFNGWYLVTGANPSGWDPVRFTLEGSMDGARWFPVGSSTFVHKFVGGTVMLNGYADVTTERLSSQYFSFQPHWTYVVDSVVINFVYSFGLCSAALVGLLWANGEMAKNILLFLFALGGVAHIFLGAFAVAGTGSGSHLDFVVRTNANNAPLYFAEAGVELGAAWQMWFDETLVLEGLMLGGLSLFIVELLDLTVWTANADKIGPLIFFRVLMFMVGAFLFMYRKRALKTVRDSIRNDEKVYNDAWASLTADMSEERTLTEIASLADRMMLNTSRSGDLHQCTARPQRSQSGVHHTQHAPLVQPQASSPEERSLPGRSSRNGSLFGGAVGQSLFNNSPKIPMSTEMRPRRASLLGGISSLHNSPSISGLAERARPRRLSMFSMAPPVPTPPLPLPEHNLYAVNYNSHVTSLDLLMAAAQGLNPILKRKVQEWAEPSGGRFPLMNNKQSVKFVKWDDAMKPGCSALKANIRWAGVKDPQRGLEKVLFSYRGDASKLTDLCRQCIVFEHFSDLLLALDEISRDESVVVERVVNRLHNSYNTTKSAGYRDVKVNLRITTEETFKLHLHTHICEVLLVPRKIMELWSEERHARYIGFRNLSDRNHYTAFKRLMSVFRINKQKDVPSVELLPPSEGLLMARSNTYRSRLAQQKVRSTHNTPMLGPHSTPGLQSQKMRQLKVQEANAKHTKGSFDGDIPWQHSTETSSPPRQSQQRSRQRRVSYGDDVLKVDGLGQNFNFDKRIPSVFSEYSAATPPGDSKPPVMNGSAELLPGSAVVAPSPEYGGKRHDYSMDAHNRSGADPVDSIAMLTMKSEASFVISPIKAEASMIQSPGLHPMRSEGLYSLSDRSLLDRGPKYEEEGYMGIVRYQFVRFVTEKATLDNGLKNWRSAMVSASAASAFYTSTPIATALVKRNVQAGFFVIGCAFFALAALLSYVHRFTPTYSYSNFRFTALELRLKDAISSPGIHDLGIMLNLCKRAFSLSTYRNVSETSMTVGFTSPMAMNGWFFETTDRDPRFDPVVFVLEGSNNPNDVDSWDVVGSSSWTRRVGWLSFARGYFDTPLLRRHQVYLDMRSTDADLVRLVGVYVKSLGFLLAGLAGYLERGFLGKWCIIAAFFIYAVMMLVIGSLSQTLTGYSADRVQVCEILTIIEGVVALLYALLVAFLERWFVMCQGLTAAAFLAIYIVLFGFARFNRDEDSLGLWLLADILLLSGALIVTVMRQRILWTSGRMIETDMHMYEAVWREIQRKDQADKYLEQIAALITAYGLDKTSKPPRQYNRVLGTMSDDWDVKGQQAAGGVFRRNLLSSGSSLSLPDAPIRTPARRRASFLASSQGSGQGSGSSRPLGALLQSAEGLDALSPSDQAPSPKQQSQEMFFKKSGSPSLREGTRRLVSSDGALIPAHNSQGSHISFHRTLRHMLTNAAIDESCDEVKYLDYNSPVTSLDQLMTQAKGLDPILRMKTKAWAIQSNGCFPLIDDNAVGPIPLLTKLLSSKSLKNIRGTIEGAVTGRRKSVVHDTPKKRFVRWSALADDPEGSDKIKWAKIKDPKRAIEKLLRVYTGDVSRLVDLTRQSIVFETLSDLFVCLRTILDDPDVDVMRIKNRLEPSYDSSISAGYRDVAVNLRVVAEDSRNLRVNTHVCEVQLILRQFAELKSDQGHKRYVEFRNARAE